MADEGDDSAELTEELENILLEFSSDVLEKNPPDIIAFAANYFARLKRERDLALEGATEDRSEDEHSEDSNKSTSNEDVNKMSSSEECNKTPPNEDSNKTLPSEDSNKKSPNEDSKKKSPNEDSKKTPSSEDSKKTTSNENVSTILGARGARRTAIVGEIFNPEDSDVTVESYPKSKEEKDRIRNRISKIFVFKHLSEEDLESVIDAMRHTRVREGQVIIRQNDDGDFFYLVDEGEFDAFVEQDGEEKFVMKYKDEGSFGELALLHNQPRMATVKAVTNGALWAVSRGTFTKLVKRTAFEKRKRYLELLDRVPELQPLSEYEKLQVCDALIPVSLKKGQTLFKEGEEGNGMYFVEKGVISVRKESEDVELAQLEAGDFLGELALVRRQPRAGTAVALQDCQLAFLDVDAFERLLGPCRDLLEERADSYGHGANKSVPA